MRRGCNSNPLTRSSRIPLPKPAAFPAQGETLAHRISFRASLVGLVFGDLDETFGWPFGAGSGLEEAQQVGVEFILVGVGNGVWRAGIHQEFALFK